MGNPQGFLQQRIGRLFPLARYPVAPAGADTGPTSMVLSIFAPGRPAAPQPAFFPPGLHIAAQAAPGVGRDCCIVLRQGSTQAVVDGESVPLPRVTEIRGGKLFVPLRFVVENLGLKLTWQQESRTVFLETTGAVP